MKTITLKNLKELRACGDGVDWFKAQNETAIDKVCLALCADNHEDWANWLIVRFMTRKQKLKYAIYAAEQVLEIFEKQHPNDARPRQAIAAAKKVLKSNTKKNRDAAHAAAHAATHAATHAAAHAAAYDAAYAVYAAAYAAAYDAAYAAYAAAYDAAYTAAHAAAHAAARKEMYLKIIKYGLRIMREKRK